MKALVVTEKNRLSVLDIPMPVIGPYQALVKIEVCGICSSTDWKVAGGHMGWAPPFPLVLGHEAVGRVVEVGAKVRKFKCGDRVTRPVFPSTADLNSAMGGFAEYGIVTDAAAMASDGDASLIGDYTAVRQNVVPEKLADPLAASLAITLAETASGMRGLPNLRGLRVAVSGTGAAGFALALWAKMAGAARVVALGRRQSRLDLAVNRFADAAVSTAEDGWVEALRTSLGGDADVLIEAVGDIALARQMLGVLAKGGVAAAYGAPPDNQQYGAPWKGMAVEEQLDYDWSVDMLSRGLVKSDAFISHVWQGLDSAPGAFEAVRRGDVLKGMVVIA